MKRFLLAAFFTLVSMISVTGQAKATSIVQNFTNSWSVDVWDYYGYVAAMDWQYQPYIASTSSLKSVSLSMDILVSEMTLGDDFRYRASFFTGWNPDAFQFYSDEWFYDVTNSNLSIKRDYLFTSSSALDRWTNPLYGPNGHYYFESTTFDNSHTVNVSTRLIFNYDEATEHGNSNGDPQSDHGHDNEHGHAPVPEPSTILLLTGGIVGLAFWRRRNQSK